MAYISADGRRTGRVSHRRPFDRMGISIFAGATAVGIWMGFAGPTDSPVAPPESPISVVDMSPGAGQ